MLDPAQAFINKGILDEAASSYFLQSIVVTTNIDVSQFKKNNIDVSRHILVLGITKFSSRVFLKKKGSRVLITFFCILCP
jgi:hypothetical protein